MQDTMTRRRFIRHSIQVAAGMAILSPGWTDAAVSKGRRSLKFHHTHTGEKLKITYAWGAKYDPIALRRINHYLRDFRTGDQHAIDPKLLDILWQVQRRLGSDGVFEVISGYRSPATNTYLRKSSGGVAKKSLHMKGKAIDVRLAGVSTHKLQRCAMGLECGGVGFYAKSDFVHLDTGRVRFW